MDEKRLAREPLLAAVDLGGKVVGAADEIEIGRRIVFLDLLDQVGDFDLFTHRFPLAAADATRDTLPFRRYNRLGALDGRGQIAVHHDIIIAHNLAYFTPGVFQPPADGAAAVGPAASEPLFEHAPGRRHDEDRDRIGIEPLDLTR